MDQKVTSVSEPEKQPVNEVEPVKEPELVTVPKKIEIEVQTEAENDPPFLSELNYEFRRTVPDVDINVFVYTENEDGRFIMINMKKYVPGQLLEVGMRLKDIRMDSIVVEYKNRVFRINRK